LVANNPCNLRNLWIKSLYHLPFGDKNDMVGPEPLAMEIVKSKYSTCTGPSMKPTLKPGDGLDLYTYEDPAEIRVGDVIVYPHPSRTIDVVHRIIEIRRDGVITRGDNNNKIDPYTIRFDDIIGKVIGAKRKNRLAPIQGGKTGFCIHKLMLFRKYFIQYGLAPLRFVSNIIAASGIFNIFHSVFNVRIIHIKRNHQSQLILVSGNRAIGKQLVGSGEWQIRFPYKYFVSKRRLEKQQVK